MAKGRNRRRSIVAASSTLGITGVLSCYDTVKGKLLCRISPGNTNEPRSIMARLIRPSLTEAC
jgi:hypothetical protein